MSADAVHLVDDERRFGGLRRLYGEAAYTRLRQLRLAVVGLGGVGSWAVEALARSGVAGLILIDLDQVAESNINRQVQAHSQSLGQAKTSALRERIALIHPQAEVIEIEDFVSAENWPQMLNDALQQAGWTSIDGVIDACDQVRAKAVLAAWARDTRCPFVAVGAAGGKMLPQAVQVQDLAEVSHDPLLASVRQRLRQHHGFAKINQKTTVSMRKRQMALRCVFSTEVVRLPVINQCDNVLQDVSSSAPQGLNCAGYGSSVTVTAVFGMVAAADILKQSLPK